MNKSKIEIVKPPWALKGSGLILVYKSIQMENQPVKGNYLGGPAVLMLVDYQSSPVGPYKELLFIPGRYDFGVKTGYQISYIRVSSDESTGNGIQNWGIPKKTGAFTVLSESNQKKWNMEDESEIVDCTFSHGRLAIPVFTKPLPYRLVQNMGEKLFITRPEASGTMTWAKLQNFKTNIPALHALNSTKPLLSVYVKNFRMVFPAPEILPYVF